MPEDQLKRLLELAKDVKFRASEREEQRRSFAFGNTNFENERITRQMVDDAARDLGEAAKQSQDRDRG